MDRPSTTITNPSTGTTVQDTPLTPPRHPSATILARLSDSDRATLDRLLSEPTPHVEEPRLHAARCEQTIFGVAAKLPASDATRFPEPEAMPRANVLSGTRVPTLSTEQEQRLFLRINLCRLRIGKILQRFAGKALTAKATHELVAWGTWEQQVRARIVELNMPLVLAMAKRTRLAGIDYAEMISEGNMALLRSVDKFDCGRGFKFSTYACRAILKSFSRVAVRTSRYRGTFPVEYDPAIEKSDHLERRRESDEQDCVDDLKDILARNMAELTDVEQTVIRQRFALDTLADAAPAPKTLEQVGQVIGVTKERVRQIQNKALRKIRTALEDNFLAA